MKNPFIRKAEISDAEAIATVQIKSWQKTYRKQIPDSFLDNMSIPDRTNKLKRFIEENKKNKIYDYVLEVDSNILGILTVGVNSDGDLPKDVGELYGIYIHPEYEGVGLGSKLMIQSLDTLRSEGYKKATLWVLNTNTKARSWYEHKGWKVEGKIKVDHRDGFDLNEIRYIITI